MPLSNAIKETFSLELDLLETIKLSIGLFLLIAILTQGKMDPTPASLVWPTGGIENWFHLPGALMGGFLKDMFGLSALFIPLFLLVAKPSVKVSGFKKTTRVLFNTVLVSLLLSILVSAQSHILLTYSGATGIVFNQYLFLETHPFLLFSFILILSIAYNIDILDEYQWDLALPLVSSYIGMAVLAVISVGGQFFIKILKVGVANSRQLIKGGMGGTKKNDALKKINWRGISWKSLMGKLSRSQKEGKVVGRHSRRTMKPTIELLTPEEKSKKKLFQNALKEFEKINYPGNDTLISQLDKRDQ